MLATSTRSRARGRLLAIVWMVAAGCQSDAGRSPLVATLDVGPKIVRPDAFAPSPGPDAAGPDASGPARGTLSDVLVEASLAFEELSGEEDAERCLALELRNGEAAPLAIESVTLRMSDAVSEIDAYGFAVAVDDPLKVTLVLPDESRALAPASSYAGTLCMAPPLRVPLAMAVRLHVDPR